MQHSFNVKVYYSDTDSYGVVWHGSYLRWLEMGRVELSEKMGLSLKELEQNDIVLPVVEINVRYKSSAMLNDNLTINTKISEMKNTSMIFTQIIKNTKTEQIYTIANVRVVATNSQGKLYKKLPTIFSEAYEKSLLTTI